MKHKLKNLISIILVLALVAGCFAAMPLPIRQASAYEVNENEAWLISNSGADAVTEIPESIADGTVWTDKSVADNKDGSFAITLSAFGRRQPMEHEIYQELYKPINVVFVLDTSSSMTITDLDAMIAATKQAGHMILDANPDNRVAVVYYDETARQASTAWTWVNPSNAPTTLDRLTRPNLVARTNIVAGLNLANNLLTNAPNKDAAEPVIVLMTDGAPNAYYTNENWTGTTGRVTGTGSATGDAASARETIKRASEIAQTNVSIYTVGYNINSNNLAWITLNPSNNIGYLAPNITPRTINAAWLSTTSTTLRFSVSNTNVDIENAPTVSKTTRGSETIDYFQYNLKFYAPLQPDDLIDSFKEIVNDITTDLASPIKAGENLVITDYIGDGFAFDLNQQIEESNTGIVYDADTHTVTWTIPASQLCLFDPSIWADGDAPFSVDDAEANMNKVT
ncbi:vWA domain-containing protein, partial [Candidatus Bathycorpusculum sp.]|uniref:vWA domain-containing protein n=1 Tax=Candidatus Bathycorpusculum sp. TaxID=2994959 RepID=UPI00282AAD9F|nr:VWA domain-containing protein [Candidatus Termitimicrobium sp.]MCL2432714.1 VWA domain-containing protein [Candidatus Termitimicrobium sp.]